MDKLIEKLGIYELFNFLFTGIITYITSAYIFYFFNVINKVQFTTYISYLKNWYFLIILYFLGIMLHEGGECFSYWIFFKKGQPSDKYFENNNHSKIKEQVEMIINKDKKIKFDLSNKDDLKQAFGIIYSTEQEKPANEMIQKMNQQFGCFRAFSFIFIAEGILSLVLLILFYHKNGLKLEPLTIFIPLGIIIWFSIRRMFRFGKRFADYCYRNYLKDNK